MQQKKEKLNYLKIVLENNTFVNSTWVYFFTGRLFFFLFFFFYLTQRL